MTADLAEFEEGVEEGDLGLLAADGEGLADVFVHGGANGFVEVFFLFAEFDEVRDLGFWGEFGGDLVFGAPEDEGPDFGGEGVGTCLIVVFLDGCAEGFAEVVGGAEEAGDEEVEEAPEFAEVVLNRGAGEAEAVGCV